MYGCTHLLVLNQVPLSIVHLLYLISIILLFKINGGFLVSQLLCNYLCVRSILYYMIDIDIVLIMIIIMICKPIIMRFLNKIYQK